MQVEPIRTEAGSGGKSDEERPTYGNSPGGR